MRRWRSKRLRSTTTFHPDASAAMSELLPTLEEWKRTGTLPGSSSGTLLNDFARNGDRKRDGDRGRERGGAAASRGTYIR